MMRKNTYIPFRSTATKSSQCLMADIVRWCCMDEKELSVFLAFPRVVEGMTLVSRLLLLVLVPVSFAIHPDPDLDIL